jgi:hypothetical protein
LEESDPSSVEDDEVQAITFGDGVAVYMRGAYVLLGDPIQVNLSLLAAAARRRTVAVQPSGPPPRPARDRRSRVS